MSVLICRFQGSRHLTNNPGTLDANTMSPLYVVSSTDIAIRVGTPYTRTDVRVVAPYVST